MAKEQLGQVVLTVDADDSKFRKTLKEDERIARDSANKMQGSLGKLRISAEGVAKSVSGATASVAAFGQAASLSGNQTAILTSQASAAGIALASSFEEATLAMQGTLGVLVAATVAVRGFKRAAAEKELSELAKTTAEADRMRVEGELKVEKSLALQAQIKRQIALIEGARPSDLIEDVKAKKLAKQLEALQDEEKAKFLARQKEEATKRFLRQLEAERVAREENIRLQEVAVRLARENALRAEGPDNLATARKQVFDEAELLQRANSGRKLLQRVIDEGRFGDKFKEDLMRRLGLDVSGGDVGLTRGPQQGGAIRLSEFAGTGRAAGAAGGTQSLTFFERQQLKIQERIAAAVETTARADQGLN